MSKPAAPPASFTAVIDLWPSIEQAVTDIGATRSMVSKWRRRDNIPADWWAPVLSTTTAKRAGVTAEMFVTFAARPRLQAAEGAEART